MKVLITRPSEDAVALARLLADKQIDSLSDPMLDIRWIDGPPLELDQVQGLLMTSANGVRAFAHRNRERDLAVYAVGDATRREAERLGFRSTHTASGDVEALAQLVFELVKPDQGTLLHCAGTRLAGDLGGALSARGYTYRREVLYEAEAARHLKPETLKALADGELTGVLLYSPRTAGIFTACLAASGCLSATRRLTAYCLSAAVAEQIADQAWAQVKIAPQPTQNSLIEIVLGRV